MEAEKFFVQIEELINKLTRNELVELNKIIINRVKAMDEFNRLMASLDLYPGDKVSWTDYQGFYHTGHIIRINAKTVSVQEENDSGGIWRITATALQKIK